MLARSGFGDDAALAHTAREQSLPQTVVNLVRTGVQQIFALEVDLRSAKLLRQPRSIKERSGASGVLTQSFVEFALKFQVFLGLRVRRFKFFERGHECFGNVASTIRAKTSGFR